MIKCTDPFLPQLYIENFRCFGAQEAGKRVDFHHKLTRHFRRIWTHCGNRDPLRNRRLIGTTAGLR